MVAIRGGYRMARGWHYAKLSLSNALCLSFSGMCILLFLFLSLCRFRLFVFFFCPHWSLVDVPLIFFCPADHVPDWQPSILLCMVEARLVNVKKITTTDMYYLKKNLNAPRPFDHPPVRGGNEKKTFRRNYRLQINTKPLLHGI